MNYLSTPPLSFRPFRPPHPLPLKLETVSQTCADFLTLGFHLGSQKASPGEDAWEVPSYTSWQLLEYSYLVPFNLCSGCRPQLQ